MNKKHYSDTERDFVFQLVDRWFQLVSLIYDLIRFDGPSPSPSPPTEPDEINYQSLRSWFMDHQLQFAPLWRDFYESQDWNLHPGDDLIAEIRDAESGLENAFFCWYGPKNLYMLFQVCVLDIQSRKPSELRAWTAAMDLLRMDKIVIKFCEWIDEQVYETP